jgi:FkbM family methyltransferase
VQLPVERLLSDFGLKPSFVIHAGANLCQERFYYEENLVSRVLWIEALEPVVVNAKKLLASLPRQEVVQAVLWSTSDEIKQFNIASNNAESSSIFTFKWHEAINPHVSRTAKVELSTTTLDELIRRDFEGHIPEITLLVLDLQGAEYEALLGGLETISRTSALHVEVSTVEMYKGQKLLSDINLLLSQKGFTLVDHDLSETIYSGDALFVRTSLIDDSTQLRELPATSRLPRISWKNWVKFALIRFRISDEPIRKLLKLSRSR